MTKFFLTVACSAALSLSAVAQTNWVYESTANGKIPRPWESTQQTASLIADLTGDGVGDVVMACRQKPPCLIFYSRKPNGQWQRYLIDNDYLTIEAGGASVDMDGDGDLDLVLAGDWQSNNIWWWENPGPTALKPDTPWNRHEIKAYGATQHHDQIVGDFKRTGRPQVVSWNQGAKTLFIADMPANPKNGPWKLDTLFSGQAGENSSWYAEGLAAGDIDGDGWLDLLGGNYWFKYQGNGTFKPIKIAEAGGRIGLGKFKPGRTMQVVVSPGDGTGKVMYYEWTGQEGRDSVDNADLWKGRDLLGRTMIHGHTMEVADVNGDGRLDFFTAEMAKWSEKKTEPDNPNAEALIFYGDGRGNFRKEVFKTGWGFHEGRVADIDGDGDMDIISKPYNWEAPRLDVWLQNGTSKRIDLKFVQQRIGLELYSFRNEMAKDRPGTLAKIKAMGINEVELAGYYDQTPEQIKAELQRAGLTPTGALFDFARFQNDVDGIIREAKLFGLKGVGCAWIPHLRLFTKADAEKGAAVFNAAGEKLRANGIRFYYHAHGYEFRPAVDAAVAGADGKLDGTLFDYMAKLMKPGLADFQIDVYWALHGGEQPAQLLRRYPGRIISLHLKDMAWGQPTGLYTGGAPISNDCIHGKGQQNFKAILQAAQQTGVQTLYIEDENLNAINQVPQSLTYLRSLK